MNKWFVHIIVILFLALACEDIYHPKLDNVDSLLVLEARFFTDPDYNYIRLTKTLNFSDDELQETIDGAVMYLYEKNGSVQSIHDVVNSSSGYYQYNDPIVPGYSYKLSLTIDGNNFESEWFVAPPLPEVDSMIVENESQVSYTKNSYGELIKHEANVFTVKANLPVTDELKNYMFEWKSVLQVYIPPPETMGFEELPDTFAWKTYYKSGLFNIAKPASYSNTDQIIKHSLMSYNKSYDAYIDTPEYVEGSYGMGWIMEIDQIGLPEAVFDFYENINEQLNAEGQLFDPVYTQITGNMTCTNDPDVEMLGMFELNSVKKRQYFVKNPSSDQVNIVELDTIYTIPESGRQPGEEPDFWQY